MSDSPRTPSLTKKRSLFEYVDEDEEELKRILNDQVEEEEISRNKKAKMSDHLTLDHMQDFYNKIKQDQAENTALMTAKLSTNISAAEDRISGQVATMQTDITTIKAKQDLQDCEVQRLNEKHDLMTAYQNEVIKRIETLERGEKTKTAVNRNGITAYQERLRDQVAKTCCKIAIYDIPDAEDTSYIRKQADGMKITQEIKNEIKNSYIELIPDKRHTSLKKPNCRLHHMTTSGIQARQAILFAAKSKPGKMRWDVVVPKDFKIGYNKQKASVWQLRNGLGLSTQQEIHGHTSYVYINEKNSSEKRRVFSEFTPVEKPQRQRRTADSMETNIDSPDDDKPILVYHENKAIADALASVIYWTGMKAELSEDERMAALAKVISPDDYALISNPVHNKYQTRLAFSTKEQAEYVYDKYKTNGNMVEGWEWSVFKLNDYKLE